jgi:hypothetical protein
MAALLSAVLLLGGVLPGLQGLCAEMASPAPQQTTMQAEAAGHALSLPHQCEADCPGMTCCVSVSSFTDRMDLQLPDRGATADLTRLRSVEDVPVPAPEDDPSTPVRGLDADALSSVRLHVWTATFLS